MTDTLKHKVLSGLIWRGLERIGTQAISFIVSIILARLLAPKDFGTLTLITIFIALSQVFVNGGFGLALVQKKEVNAQDYNSVFFLSMSVAFLFYGILFFCAPWIAIFYREPVLVGVLRLLSLSLIIGALNLIQYAVLNREMKFKLSYKVSLSSLLVSGCVGIGMAYGGCGVWALVGSSLGGQIATTIVLWRVVRWRPSTLFSFVALRQMFGFSSKLLLSGLLDTIFSNLYNLTIGKLFNPVVLGYYSRGQSIPNMMMTGVNGTISGVIFPALASCQHDKQRVKEIMRRMIKTSCFLVFPMMFGLAAVSKSFVAVVLTEKWLPCVPYLQFSCIIFSFWPLHVANLQAINALGRSDIFLRLEIIKKSLVILNIIITYRFGPIAMVVGQAILSVACFGLNARPNQRLLDYSILHQFQDVLPAFLLSAGMGLIVWGLELLIVNQYLLLGVQVGLGALVYFFGAKLFRLESANYLWRTGYQMLASRMNRFRFMRAQ